MVLSTRWEGNGREEDGAEEKESLEKHSGRVWRRWASKRRDRQESEFCWSFEESEGLSKCQACRAQVAVAEDRATRLQHCLFVVLATVLGCRQF
jgi:hypothetical protein